MSESTFRDLTQQLTELYDKKQEYAQAFALLQSEYAWSRRAKLPK